MLKEEPANERRGALIGRPAIINLEDVVACAAAMAKRVGLDRLTMGMVADKLGVTPTALYHYVPNKQALIDLVVDTVLSRVQAPAKDAGSWDKRIVLFERAVRHELLALPRTIASITGDGAPRPAVRRLFDIGIEILSESGADDREVRLAFTTIFAYMMGQLTFDGVSPGSSFPELETIQAATGRGAFTRDDLFEYGIETIVNGLRDRLGQKRPARPIRRIGSRRSRAAAGEKRPPRNP